MEAERPAGQEGLRRFSYPSDIVAGYHVRLVLYGALDVFAPSGSKTRALSLLVAEADEALGKLREALGEGEWELSTMEAEGRGILVAESPDATVGVVASEAEDGQVLTLVLSSRRDEALGRAERELRAILAEICPSAQEVAGERESHV